MTACQLVESTWGKHPHYRCGACNISTLDEAAASRRCQLTAPVPAGTTSTGLLGPDGQPAVSEPVAVGGGYYELPNGERVRGRPAADAAMNEPSSHDDAA